MMPARKLNKGKVVLAAALLTIFAGLLYLFGLFVMVLWLSLRNPSGSAFMDHTLAELRLKDPEASIKYQWVPYEKISASLKRAVIASEDSNFANHGGVEWEAIRKAWEYNRKQEARGRSKRRGGSTITQQLAKNIFLSSERSYIRKGQELILAYMIELVMSKERILELYLNVAQWGKDVFGAEAAARHAPQPGLLRRASRHLLHQCAHQHDTAPHAAGGNPLSWRQAMRQPCHSTVSGQ
jgi:monofunctional biosynthetic peptidoglycan transglycosylase